MKFSLHVNGEARSVDIDPRTPLVWVLRDELDLKGTKYGCGMSLCGACTVHVDGRPIRACVTPVADVADASITTIEGIGATLIGSKVQKAWLDVDVVQCGCADRKFKRRPYVGTGLAASALNPARAMAGNPPGRPPCLSFPVLPGLPARIPPSPGANRKAGMHHPVRPVAGRPNPLAWSAATKAIA